MSASYRKGLRVVDREAEMTRLFVQDAYRGLGLDSALGRATVDRARELGYASIKLDMLSLITAAIGQYRSLGFKKIARYRRNPREGARFFELVFPGA